MMSCLCCTAAAAAFSDSGLRLHFHIREHKRTNWKRRARIEIFQLLSDVSNFQINKMIQEHLKLSRTAQSILET